MGSEYGLDDDEREGKLTHLIFQWHDCDDTADLLLSASIGSPASTHIDRHFLDAFADSESNIVKIRRILQSCNERHTQCRLNNQVSSSTSTMLSHNVTIPKSLPSSVLPTRVVVTQYEDHGKTGPFLQETGGRSGVYASLSYRWSPDSQIITTRQTLESNKTKLDFGPHTGTRIFSDAVSLCRKLGIPYLWIDALCIIQHDPTDPLSNLDDWEKEAKSMGRVYGDCVLTIAATGSSDNPSIGLFGDRSAISQSIELPFRLESWDKPNGTFSVSLPPEGFDQEVNHSELYSRGWVMQERLLSHRYLHFGKTQWFWQCRQSTISEMPGFEDQEKTIGSNFESGRSDNYLDKPTKVVRRWMKIVEAYSKLNFTVKTDRFVAIQGIVSETAKASGDDYLYGMWSKLLYVQLQWFIHRRDNEVESESEDVSLASEEHYRPSWSWQSTTKRISYHTQFEGDKFYEKVPEEPITKNYLKATTVTLIRPAFEHIFTSRPSAAGLPPRKVLVMRARIGAISLDFNDAILSHTTKQRQKGVNDERYKSRSKQDLLEIIWKAKK
ncbi:heterokaryon incompatibility protein-domain-containing protein [Leptodontidium sp. MPI-SDFR-AT-0119]|nr:heterokaryon incompatibility protein-domain-containing protein [Leptodontidium sp. MPI-SDFR-AT-0119]